MVHKYCLHDTITGIIITQKSLKNAMHFHWLSVVVIKKQKKIYAKLTVWMYKYNNAESNEKMQCILTDCLWLLREG